jgi:hypothetical protein
MSVVNALRSHMEQCIQQIECLETLFNNRLVISHNLDSLEERFRHKMTLQLAGRPKKCTLSPEDLQFVKRAWYPNESALRNLYTLWQARGSLLSFPTFVAGQHTTSVEQKALAAIEAILPLILQYESANVRGNLVTSTLLSASDQRTCVYARFDDRLWFGTARYFFLYERKDGGGEIMARVDWHKTVGKQKHSNLPVFSTAAEDIDVDDRFVLGKFLGSLALTFPHALDRDDERIGVIMKHSEMYDADS